LLAATGEGVRALLIKARGITQASRYQAAGCPDAATGRRDSWL